MSPFELLAAPIREYIWDKKWQKLNAIQETAITQFYNTENNLLIAAPTASGKTEAAFLPSISTVKDWHEGVKIVYISPLIALINDQFRRVDELSKYLDIPITSWHGEALQSAKKRLIKNPEGILLITPESIEAILVRRPNEAKRLFGHVETVIIDEIHSFLGTTRGLHLQSLLHRTAAFAEKPPRYIGLSATIPPASYDYAKSFFGPDRQTAILLDRGSNGRDVTFHYMPGDSKSTLLPPDVIDDLFARSNHDRMLVFPNARSRVEEVTVGLQRRAQMTRSDVHYFAHHASVDKELRLEAEQFAKTSTHDLFTICCTSTLELGIDIGSVDTVAQVEAPHSVASLAQRLGRSGRRTGVSKLVQYTTSPWSLLQSLAALSLLEEGLLDPIVPLRKQYSMLFQQILSILSQHSGMASQDLLRAITALPPAADITKNHIQVLIDSMVENDYIEVSDEDMLVGLGAERIVTSRGFYAHFQDKTDFTVLSDGRKIGELSYTPELTANTNVFLAGKIWKITDIDTGTKKILVQHAKDGKPPTFLGDAGNVSALLRQRMHDLLTKDYSLPVSAMGNALITVALDDIRQQTQISAGMSAMQRRIVADKYFFTFTGSRINYTLATLLTLRSGTKPTVDDSGQSCLEAAGIRKKIANLIHQPATEVELRNYLTANADSRPPMTAKYMHYLPDELLIDELLAQYYDLDATNKFLSEITL